MYLLAVHFYREFKSLQEGLGWRIVLNKQEFDRRMREVEKNLVLSAESLSQLAQSLDRQIELGHLSPSDRDARLQHTKEEIEFGRRFAAENSAREDSKSYVPVPGEPEVIERLLNGRTPDQIRRICAKAFMSVQEKDGLTGDPITVKRPAWPISDMSLLPKTLTQHAAQFIESKDDPRFPKSGRPTSRDKQLWFLSRALAGAVHGLSTRTSINLIGSVRPDERTVISNLTKRTRRGPRKAE